MSTTLCLVLLLLLLLLVSLCGLSHSSPDKADMQHWQLERPTSLAAFDPAVCPHRGAVSDQVVEGGSVVSNNWQPGSEPTAGRQLGMQTSSLTQLRPAALRSAALGVEGEAAITPGTYLSGYLETADTYHYFAYKPSALNLPFDIFVGIGSCGAVSGSVCDIHVYMNGSPFPVSANATFDWHYYNSIRIDSAHPMSCEYRNVPLDSCEYHYSLRAWNSDQQYETAVMLPPSGLAEMRSGITLTGTLDGGAYSHYYLINGAVRDIMIFALTATVGDCDLYVSTISERPGPSNYTWSSVDEGDDVVIVNGTTAGPEGRAGLYYFIGVYNKRTTSSSSYSIIGSGYNTRGSPGDNYWYVEPDLPQKDYAMANSFRYYYVYISGVWPKGMLVTLASMRGDADMSASQPPLPACA